MTGPWQGQTQQITSKHNVGPPVSPACMSVFVQVGRKLEKCGKRPRRTTQCHKINCKWACMPRAPHFKQSPGKWRQSYCCFLCFCQEIHISNSCNEHFSTNGLRPSTPSLKVDLKRYRAVQQLFLIAMKEWIENVQPDQSQKFCSNDGMKYLPSELRCCQVEFNKESFFNKSSIILCGCKASLLQYNTNKM